MAQSASSGVDKLRGSLGRFGWAGSDLLLALLVLVCLLPVWLFPFFPTQDGPSHIENARVLLDLTLTQSPLHAFYELNLSSPTNWLGHLGLAALMLLAPPIIAEKLFVTAYIILCPLSVRYALRALQPESAWLAILSLPLVATFVLYKGFYNFCASLPLYFFLLGYWARHKQDLTTRTTILLAVLSLLLYVAHVFSWIMAALAIGLLTLWFSVQEVKRTHDAWPVPIKRRLLPAIGFLIVPAVLLLAFVSRGEGEPLRLGLNWTVALQNLVRLTALVALDEREYWLAAAFGILLLSLVGYQFIRRVRVKTNREWDGWLLVGLVYLVVYVLAPNAFAGGSFVKQRLALFVCFALIFWLGAQSYALPIRRLTQFVLACWVVGLLLIRWGAHADLNAQVADVYATSSSISPGATFLPLTFATHVEDDPESSALSRVRVMLHSAGYVAAARDAVNLANYEARTDYFPLRYRPSHSPVGYFDRLSSGKPTMDLEGYARHAGVAVDYVLLLAEDAPFGAAFEPPAEILDQLASRYDLVYTSPRGLVRLYRRRHQAHATGTVIFREVASTDPSQKNR